MTRYLILASAIALSSPVVAQPVSPPGAATPESLDPARLAAADKLIEATYPADRREQVVASMMKTMIANLTGGMRSNPQIAAAFDSDPRVEPIFTRFLARVETDSEARLKAALPGMIEAIRRAYARRFTTDQMTELAAFFSTPTGRAYFEQGQSIMSDPDVAAWQRTMMADAFGKMPEQMRALFAELSALKPPLKTK